MEQAGLREVGDGGARKGEGGVGEQEKYGRKLSLATCDRTKNLTLDPCRHGFRITTEDATTCRFTIYLARIGKHFPCANVRPRVLCRRPTCSTLPSCSFALTCTGEAEKAYLAAARRFELHIRDSTSTRWNFCNHVEEFWL